MMTQQHNEVLAQLLTSHEAQQARERLAADRDAKRLALHNEKQRIQSDASHESGLLRKELHGQQKIYNELKQKLLTAEQELKRLESGISRLSLNVHTRLQRLDAELRTLANPALSQFIGELEELHLELLNEKPVVKEQHDVTAFGNLRRTALFSDAKSKARLLQQIRQLVEDTRQRQLDPEQNAQDVAEWIDAQRQTLRPAAVERIQ